MTEQRCPECGYTEEDKRIQGDHYLCGSVRSTFDGGENDPLIKSGAVKEMDKFPSRFSLFIPMELSALESTIVYALNMGVAPQSFAEILICLKAEIRKEQERIALCSK